MSVPSSPFTYTLTVNGIVKCVTDTVISDVETYSACSTLIYHQCGNKDKVIKLGEQELIASPRKWENGCSIRLAEKDDAYLVCVMTRVPKDNGSIEVYYAPLATYTTTMPATDAWAAFTTRYDFKPSADALETTVPITVSKSDKPAAWVLTILKGGSKLHETYGFVAGVASPTRSADIEAAKKKKEAETIMSNAAAEKKKKRVQEIIEEKYTMMDLKVAKKLALDQFKKEQEKAAAKSPAPKSKAKVAELEAMLEAANAEIAELRAKVKKQRVEE